VNVERLKRQFQRELKANPKKAGILGLLVAVALWFWAPLVWGWFAKEPAGNATTPTATTGPNTTAAATEPAAGGPAAGGSPPGDAAGAAATISWTERAARMDRDPRRKPAVNVAGHRDPFAGARPAVIATFTEQTEQEVADLEARAVTPQDAGLVVTSTIVGPLRRVALIGGRAYKVGDTIAATTGTDKFEFRLVDVRPHSVMVAAGGQEYELTIDSGSLADALGFEIDEPR